MATDASAAEPANPGTFTLTRTGPTTAALTVSFTVGGTATNGSDYAAIPTSVTIPAGASSVTVTVSPLDDALVEGSETVVLTLSGSTAYQVGAPGAATLTIADNDLPTVTVVATDASAAEPGDPGTFTITRNGPTTEALTVSFTIGGTATNGSDYTTIPTTVTILAGAASVTITVSPLDDTLIEPSETVVLTLVGSTAYQVGVPGAATVSLADNDTNTAPVLQPIGNTLVHPSRQVAMVSLSASDADGDPILFTASAQSLAYLLSVQTGGFVYHPEYDNWGGQNEKWLLAGGQWYILLYTGALSRWSGSGMSGTPLGNIGSSYYEDPRRLESAAANDAHVSLSITGTTLTISRDPAWVSAAVITVTASDGRGGSDSESFTLFVSTAAPPLPAVSVTASDATAAEPANPGVFTLTRSGPTTEALTVSFTVSGTASNGSDYTALPSTVTIPAGASSVTVTVSPIDDSLLEGNETVVLTLVGSTAYQVGVPAAAVVTLADNEVNTAPVLQPIADRTVTSATVELSVPLSASDSDGDPISYTVSAQSLAYLLSVQSGGFAYAPGYDNWGGQNERWFLASGQWYFLLGNGELFRWSGSGMGGTLLGNVGFSYYQDPRRLENPAANDAHVSLSVSGNTLTISRDPAWVSAAVITVTASDGRGGSDSESFSLFVTGP